MENYSPYVSRKLSEAYVLLREVEKSGMVFSSETREDLQGIILDIAALLGQRQS